MQTTRRHVAVLVTAPDLRTARRLIRGALTQQLVACGNLIPGLESHYWWKGKIEKGREVLILFKTTRTQLASLERYVLEAHPYDTPAILALPIEAGTARYLQWITDSLGS